MFFKLSQGVSNKFCLNRFNEISLKSRLYINWSAWFLGEEVVLGLMMNVIGKWSDTSVSIILSTFKIIIKDGIGNNVIYCLNCMTSHSCWLIYCSYHARFKRKIKKILDFIVVFIIENINIKITCKEKCFVSFGIFWKNFSEKGFSYT